MILHGYIDQTLVNSLHGLLNCEIGGLDCHVITTEYKCIQLVSIVYTCNTYFVIHWFMYFIQECQLNVLMQYQIRWYMLFIQLNLAYNLELSQ